MFAAGSSESFGGCLLAPAQRVQSFRRHRQARDGASRHLLQPSLPQVGRPRLVPHVKIMHYILMVILSVLFVCFATDSWCMCIAITSRGQRVCMCVCFSTGVRLPAGLSV